MSKILQIAMAQLGVKEIKGREHTEQILNYSKEIGMSWVSEDETPWCSIFVNWVCKNAGAPMSKKANARSWVNVGTSTNDPRPGDVIVFWRESPTSWKGHVGFFIGFSADNTLVFCLGGNQGDSVSINAYSKDKVLRYQQIDVEPDNLGAPKGVLKKGSSGKEVFRLQILLNRFGYPCGDPDSRFGPKTESALKVFQADSGIAITGEYRKQSKTAFEEILNSTA